MKNEEKILRKVKTMFCFFVAVIVFIVIVKALFKMYN